MNVDFIVIGAMKCATSTVCAYLEDHPDVFMPKGEPNFFSHDENFKKGLDWYNEFFRERRNERVCGEGSNDYAAGRMFPNTVERMASYNRKLKLVYMVRHPIDRIIATWIQDRSDNGDKVPRTLDLAVIERPDFYIDPSLYWINLTRYLRAFSEDQIFVGFVEDLSQDPTLFFKRLSDFLGVPPNYTVQRGHQNPSKGKTLPTRYYSIVNNMPLVDLLKRFLPSDVKTYVKRNLLSTVVSEHPTFSSKVGAQVMNAVRADAQALLAHYGKPVTFWDFG